MNLSLKIYSDGGLSMRNCDPIKEPIFLFHFLGLLEHAYMPKCNKTNKQYFLCSSTSSV